MAGKRKEYVVYKKGEPDTKWKWYDASSFGDKMRRLKLGEPSPTVVAHLAKDGYMFVHPTEDRTISILEAARIQSFPDSFDFSAGGTIAFPTKCAKLEMPSRRSWRWPLEWPSCSISVSNPS